MKRFRTKAAMAILLGLLLLLLWPRMALQAQAEPIAAEPIWYEVDDAGNVQLHLYFFWSESCPHCRVAHPFVAELPTRYPWLVVHDLEVSQHPAHAEQYVQLAAALGEEAQYVPAFFYCGTLTTGYADAVTSGAVIADNLQLCYGQISAYTQAAAATATGATAVAVNEVVTATAETALAQRRDQAAPARAESENPLALPAASLPTVALPWVGRINLQALSLPLLTVVIAGLDAFNPCAFFVLMFLLSLMVHGGSRRRMLLIGGVFVFFSGLLYFVFMAAWLNLFLLIGALRWITVVAGIVAVFFALINIKDYFWFKQGVSLSIPARAKPQLYQRTRQLLRAERLSTMLLGTTMLALAANAYELLCTSGFPMIYTRTLTLNALTPAAYYLYLALYNLIYVIPLLVIVLLFAVKFGSRKLKEEEGRTLKLLSGLMMLMLGVLLIVAPDRLGQVWIAVTLLVAALVLTAITVFVQRIWSHKPAHAPGKR